MKAKKNKEQKFDLSQISRMYLQQNRSEKLAQAKQERVMKKQLEDATKNRKIVFSNFL